MSSQKNLRHKTSQWYKFGLDRALYLTAWIAISIIITLIFLDMFWYSFPEHRWNWIPIRKITMSCLIIVIGSLIFAKTITNRLKSISLILASAVLIASVISVYAYIHAELTGKESPLAGNIYLKYLLNPESRMALFTAICLSMFSVVTLLILLGRKNVAHALNIVLVLLCYFFLISYILHVYSAGTHIMPVSLNTSIALTSLAILIFVLYPDTWFMRVFTSGSSGAIIARQMLLPLIFIPVIIGWLTIYGSNSKFFVFEESVVFVAVTYTVFFITIAWITARSIDKIDRERLAAVKKLQESEDRFRTIAESLPVLFAITRKSDSILLYTNDTYDISFGYEHEKVIGKKAEEMYYNPGDRIKVIKQLQKEGFINGLETRVRRSDGTSFWVLASIRSIIFEGEPAFMSALVNIDERKKEQEQLLRLNRKLNALGKSSQVMMHTNNEYNYLRDVCRIVTEELGFLMVWIGYARDDENKTVEPVAYYGLDKGYINNMKITWDESERGMGPTGTTIRTGRPTICRNMLTDPAFLPWRDEAVKRGYASSLVLPLNSDGKTFGSMSVYSREPDSFDEEDLSILTSLANDMAYGIMHLRLAEFERKSAAVIKESEVKFRLLFERMAEALAFHEIILDEHGIPVDYRFLNVNPSFERQTGLKPEEIIGKTAKQILPKLDHELVEIYGKVALNGTTTDFETYSSDLNSYFRVNAFCPKKGYFACIFENITSRVLAEKELKNTKDYLENLINYANAPIVVWNPAMEIQLFNHTFEQLTGYTSFEVLGKKIDILIPESNLQESLEKIRSSATQNWEDIEIQIMTRDGNKKTILWNSANLYDPDNKTVISTIAQGHDITQRIQAEKELRNAKENLDLALNNSNIGIWSLDLRNNKLEWDDRIGTMLGLEKNDEIDSFENFEKHIWDEDLPHFKRAVEKAVSENTSMDTIFRTRNNGSTKYIEAKGRVEKDIHNNPVSITGVCLDITGMKMATDKALFALNEDLLRSNKELEQFAYVASHDLQEPLRMVSSFTQLLASRYKDKLDSQASEFIEFAVDGAKRMQQLINDLLQYSRIKTRGKSLSIISMNNVLKETLRNLSVRISETDAAITSDDLPFVYADEGQMIQLLQNLIENGIKFSDKQPVIHISASEEAEFARFWVKDNGIGIESQYNDRIFQIFQRLHLKDEYGGTGIGLAVCQRIVERHGGKIWVDSSNSEGTVFSFTIRKKS